MTDITQDQFAHAIETDGYVIVENVLDEDFVRRAKKELEEAIHAENAYHGTEEHPGYGMVLLCSLYGGTFWELFDNPRLTTPFEWVLGEGCTVYAYTSTSMPPHKSNFSNRVHTDCPRVIPGYVTNMGATIALDDFTEDNGATWYLPASQQRVDQPGEDEFFSNAIRFVAPAGSVCFFNARLWHYGAPNTTDRWRHGLSINMARPWMKQRIDIPRAMEDMDVSEMSQVAAQKLGFLAQVPANYDEYYLPPERRKFRQKTE